MRQEKQLLLDEIKGQIEQIQILCHHAISRPQRPIKPMSFRREVARLGGNVEMVRKRLLIKAAARCGY